MKISDGEFRAFVEEVKRKNPLADVIEGSGAEYQLFRRGGGAEIRGLTHNSLVVNQETDVYFWNSQHEGGDVFSWLMKRNPDWDFMACLKHLAKQAGMEVPRVSTEYSQAVLEARKREDVWAIAVPLMERWLREDTQAWAYVTNGPAYNGKPRYFSEETICKARLGYTGGRPEHKAEMTAALEGAGIDPMCPAAVAIVGYRGDVGAWAARWEITPNENWLGQGGQDGYISGLLGAKRLVYPNIQGGRVVGFSGRNILGSEIDREGNERKSYEMPRALAGEKQLYHNYLVTRRAEELAIVEGPGDAVACAQMGMPAVALLGLAAERYTEELGRLRKYTDGRGDQLDRTVYLGVDADEAGITALAGKDESWPALKVYGPMARLLNWQGDRDRARFEVIEGGKDGKSGRRKDLPVKDANDYLASIAQWSERARKIIDQPTSQPGEEALRQPSVGSTGEGNEGDRQADARDDSKEAEPGTAEARLKRFILDKSRLLVLAMAQWAGKKEGAEKHRARRLVGETIAQLDLSTFRMYRAELAKALGEKPADLEMFRNSILQEQKEREKRDRDVGEAVLSIGGWMQDHLVELLYDPEEERTAFAVRYPDGRIEETDSVVIDGTRYAPIPPSGFLRANMVLLPSEIGNPRSVLEMLVVIQGFIRRYLDVEPGFERLCAYYVMLSWCYDMFSVVPYLRAKGDFGTGKSRFIRTVGVCCYRPLMIGSATVSPIFRMLDAFRGTLILDEADFTKSDESAEIMKILNNGSEFGFPVVRSESVGDGKFEPVSYQVYGPKVIATRKRFGDEATESRCITREMGAGTPREDIPIVLQWNFWEEARAVRNMLLGWRLRVWRPKMDVDYNQVNRNISNRLNQMTLALKTIMRDDAAALADIDKVMEKLYAQQAVELSMTVEAKVLEAIAQILAGPKSKMDLNGEKYYDFSIKNITKITNEILDKENEMDGEEDEEEKRRRRALTPKGVGRYLREKLNFATERGRDGYTMVFEQSRYEQLVRRYGIE